MKTIQMNMMMKKKINGFKYFHGFKKPLSLLSSQRFVNDADTIIGVYRGQMSMDIGIVYSPYIPVLRNRYHERTINPNFYGQLNITNNE